MDLRRSDCNLSLVAAMEAEGRRLKAPISRAIALFPRGAEVDIFVASPPVVGRFAQEVARFRYVPMGRVWSKIKTLRVEHRLQEPLPVFLLSVEGSAICWKIQHEPAGDST